MVVCNAVYPKEKTTYVDIIDILNLWFPIAILGEHLVSTSKRNRPMHQVEVNVVHSKVVQARVESLFNIIRMMLVTPEFSDDEDLVSRDTAVLDALPDGAFGSVAVVFLLV